MTAYQDIYRDLPSRVYEVWQLAQKAQKGEAKDLSVTAMLMAAVAGLAMPLEDIYIGAKKTSRPDHVTRDTNDQVAYQSAIQQFKDFFSQELKTSRTFADAKFARCTELSEVRNVGECGEGTPLDFANHKVSFAFSILRNALAHNNIVAFGFSVDKIEKLTFFSEWREGSGSKRKVVGWNVLTMSTESFEKFLKFWFKLVSASGSYAAAIDALNAE